MSKKEKDFDEEFEDSSSYLDFIEEFKTDDFKFYLYKKEEKKWAQAYQEDDEILTKDEIGKRFGGGEYKVIISYVTEENKRTTKTERFKMHSSYNRFIERQSEQVTAINNGNNEIVSSIAQMGENFNNTLATIQQNNQQMMMMMMNNNKQSSGLEGFSGMNKVMGDMMSSNFNNMYDLQNRLLEQQQPESKSELVELLKPVLEMLPALLALPSGAQKKLINKNVPKDVYSLMKNPEEMKSVNKMLAGKFGKKKARKIINSFEQASNG